VDLLKKGYIRISRGGMKVQEEMEDILAQLKGVKIDKMSELEIYEELQLYFQQNAENYHDLQNAKAQKVSVNQWMDHKLDAITPGLNEQIKQSMDSSFTSLNWEKLLFRTEIKYWDQNKNTLFKNSPSFDQKSVAEEQEIHQSLVSKLHSEADLRIKMKLALKYISKVSPQSWEDGLTLLSYAMMIDQMYYVLKIGYLIATNEIRITDVLDILIDLSASRIITLAEITAKNIGKQVGRELGTLIAVSTLVYMDPVFRYVGSQVGEYVGIKVGRLCGKGIIIAVKYTNKVRMGQKDELVRARTSTYQDL